MKGRSLHGFLEPGLLPGELPRYPLPLNLSGREMALPGTARKVSQYVLKDEGSPKNWDAE
jgi:hypothetical protein